MQQAFLELTYARTEDGAPATLVATLPTVRPLDIGGAATDLRLPGVDPAATFATISHAYDHFRIEPATDGIEPVLVNQRPVDEGGVELRPGDVIRIRECELTFQEGEPAEEPPLIDTPLRWKLRRPELDEEDSVALGDENSRPYVEEFHVTIRPLLQSERFADVQRRAESEIKRILRLDEAESLERYMQVLWWTRVRMARESGDARAADIAREAVDLYRDFSPLMVACGTTFLASRDWQAARDAFQQALTDCRPEFVVSRHDARIGRILAEHCAATADDVPSAAPRPPNQWTPGAWQVPSIQLHAPGDELLMWRMARYARLFGPVEKVRYVYRGHDESEGRETRSIQRWEIFDGDRNVVFRRQLIVPAISLADPGLILETQSICELFAKADREWNKNVIDLSHQVEDEPETAPVSLDQTAIDALPEKLDDEPPCVRIWCRSVAPTGKEIHVDLVRQPTQGDVVYRQGALCVAVAPEDASNLAGSQLYFLRKPPGFHLKMSGGQWIAAKYDAAKVPTRRQRRTPMDFIRGLTFIQFLALLFSGVATVLAVIQIILYQLRSR